MKSFAVTLALMGLASAGPAYKELDTRQLGGANENALKDGDCAGNVFIFARGSTEGGNMVSPLLSYPFPCIITLLTMISLNRVPSAVPRPAMR